VIREDLLDALPDAFALLDLDWRYVLVNRAAIELLGTTVEQLLGRPLWETWPTGLDGARPALARARNGRRPFEAETGGLGGQRRLRYRFTFPQFGTLVQLVEVPAPSQAGGAGALEHYDALLGMIGHELRNSFSSIKHGIELLRKEGADQTLDPQLDALERRAKHFSRIVDDLMTASGLLRGDTALNRSDIRLAEVISLAIEAVRGTFEDKRQRVELTLDRSDLVLEADPIRLEQVLINLLANAAKYSSTGGTITVAAIRHEDEITIRVRDDGIGIAPEELPQVFELFFRGGRRSEGSGSGSGFGIGLAVARRLVELHGGTLTAYSAGPGQGSEFTIRLPAR
jgi:signal transduction histidine kinase